MVGGAPRRSLARGRRRAAGRRADLGRPPGARLKRALAARSLTSAEPAAFEIASIQLEQARELVELYAEKGDPKYERAALKYLARYMPEGIPSLADLAQIAAVLAERGLLMRGL